MKYQSNGKLLITGEYLILDGAQGLAFPTKFGQKMLVYKLNTYNGIMIWKSFNNKLELWFSCIINLTKMTILKSSNNYLSNQLLNIFKSIQELNPFFFIKKEIIKLIHF